MNMPGTCVECVQNASQHAHFAGQICWCGGDALSREFSRTARIFIIPCALSARNSRLKTNVGEWSVTWILGGLSIEIYIQPRGVISSGLGE
jgi:hypothetical protein